MKFTGNRPPTNKLALKPRQNTAVRHDSVSWRWSINARFKLQIKAQWWPNKLNTITSRRKFPLKGVKTCITKGCRKAKSCRKWAGRITECFPSLSLCLSLCLSPSLCLSLCLTLSLSPSLSLPLSVSVSLCLCLPLSPPPSVCLCLSVSLSLSLRVCQWRWSLYSTVLKTALGQHWLTNRPAVTQYPPHLTRKSTRSLLY